MRVRCDVAETTIKEFECNAIIESATVRLDHDCFLSMWLFLKYDGAGQGFGGYVLGGLPDIAAGKHSEQKNIAAEFIVQCLRVCGVESVDACVGKVIRVRKKKEFGDILAIGHAIKDIWFYPRVVLEEMTREEGTPATGGVA